MADKDKRVRNKRDCPHCDQPQLDANLQRHIVVCPANRETVQCNICSSYVHFMHQRNHDANHEEQRDQKALKLAQQKARRSSDLAMVATMEAEQLRESLDKKHEALQQQAQSRELLRALKRKDRLAKKEELEAFKAQCKELRQSKKQEKMERKKEANIAAVEEKLRLKQQEIAELQQELAKKRQKKQENINEKKQDTINAKEEKQQKKQDRINALAEKQQKKEERTNFKMQEQIKKEERTNFKMQEKIKKEERINCKMQKQEEMAAKKSNAMAAKIRQQQLKEEMESKNRNANNIVKMQKHEERMQSRSGKELTRKAEKEECANCSHLISKRFVEQHMTKCSSANPKFCDICQRHFLRGIYKKSHDASYHNVEQKWACDKCERKLGSYDELVRHERKCWKIFQSDKRCQYCQWQLNFGQSLPEHRRDECLCCFMCYAQQKSVEHRYEHQRQCFQHDSRWNELPIQRHILKQQELRRVCAPWFIPQQIHARIKSQQELADYLQQSIVGAIHLTGPPGTGKSLVINHGLRKFAKQHPEYTITQVDAFEAKAGDIYRALSVHFLGADYCGPATYSRLEKFFKAHQQQGDVLQVMKQLRASKRAIANRHNIKVVMVIDHIDQLCKAPGGAQKLEEITAWADGVRLKIVLTSNDNPEDVQQQYAVKDPEESSDSSADPFSQHSEVGSVDCTILKHVFTTLVFTGYTNYSLESILVKRLPPYIIDRNIRHAIQMTAVKTFWKHKGDARLCFTSFVRALEMAEEENVANNSQHQPSISKANVAPSQHNHRDHTQQLLVKFKQILNPNATARSVDENPMQGKISVGHEKGEKQKQVSVNDGDTQHRTTNVHQQQAATSLSIMGDNNLGDYDQLNADHVSDTVTENSEESSFPETILLQHQQLTLSDLRNDTQHNINKHLNNNEYNNDNINNDLSNDDCWSISNDDHPNDKSVVVTRAMAKKRVQFNILADCIKFSAKEAASAATVNTKVVTKGEYDGIYANDVGMEQWADDSEPSLDNTFD